MRHNSFLLVFCLLLCAVPSILADSPENEIPLIGFAQLENSIGNNPLDSPEQSGDQPPRPNDFHAFIDGRTLTVTSEAPMPARLRVYNLNTSQLVVNRYFMVSDSQLLPSAGTYQIQIHIGRLTLTAEFEVE